MRITAGIASPEQYLLYTQAGADEVFCGYVPDSWTERWGTAMPMNRREVRCCPVQLCGRSELRILADMIRDVGCPAALTFNAPCYRPDQLEAAVCAMEDCLAAGFRDVIIADPALLQLMHDRGLTADLRVHISGEMGECNRYTLARWRMLGARRIILHRHTGLGNMAALIAGDTALHPEDPLEWEAFAMNELCHFTGAYCAGLHSDELAHLCHVPWRLGPVEACGDPAGPEAPTGGADPALPGFSGCGLCALPSLHRAGVTHLKVVGRGAAAEDMVRDITALRRALAVMDDTLSLAEWRETVRRICFDGACSGVCYYR